MRLVSITLILALGACGRFGFSEEQNQGDADGAPAPDSAVEPDASTATPLISCESPERFQVGSASVNELQAIATNTGFALFTFTTGGTLAGWAYEWTPAGLAATSQNVVIGTDLTATFGAAVVGDDIVLAAVTSTGTTRLYPLNNDLSARGPVTTVTQPVGTTPIAANGAASQLAMVNIDPTSMNGDLQALDSLGTPSGTPTNVAPGADTPGSMSIRPAENGFLVAWSAAAPSPNALRIALANTSEVTAGPVTANVSTFDPLRPKVLWAPISNVYLVSWFEKNATDDDDIWIQVLDENLAPITVAQVIANFGVGPELATDGTNFWITWRNYSASRLESARVTPSGEITPFPVTTSGGTPAEWAMLERSGQPVLAWTESGGSGPDLWLAALCP